MNKSKNLQEFIEKALQEDIGSGDHTSLATIDDTLTGKAYIMAKSDGIIAGVELAQMIFSHYDNKLEVEVLIQDGQSVKKGDIILNICGKMRSILSTERVVLNCMQRMSGIAGKAKQLRQILKDFPNIQILDTRKTTPLCRHIEKWAVRIGACNNHRWGLYDEILIKDNHVDACGGMSQAMKKVELYVQQQSAPIPVVVECRDIEEIKQVLPHQTIVKRILLDNMSPTQIVEALQIIGGQIQTEASGNITQDNILDYAKTGLNAVSTGMLTHSALPLDLSLKVKQLK